MTIREINTKIHSEDAFVVFHPEEMDVLLSQASQAVDYTHPNTEYGRLWRQIDLKLKLAIRAAREVAETQGEENG